VNIVQNDYSLMRKLLLIIVYCLVFWKINIVNVMRFVAFLTTEYDEVFSGYQLGQVVEQ